jgi:hypothetical protein
VADGFNPTLVLSAPPLISSPTSTITPAAIALFVYQAKNDVFVPITAELHAQMNEAGYSF